MSFLLEKPPSLPTSDRFLPCNDSGGGCCGPNFDPRRPLDPFGRPAGSYGGPDSCTPTSPAAPHPPPRQQSLPLFPAAAASVPAASLRPGPAFRPAGPLSPPPFLFKNITDQFSPRHMSSHEFEP